MSKIIKMHDKELIVNPATEYLRFWFKFSIKSHYFIYLYLSNGGHCNFDLHLEVPVSI